MGQKEAESAPQTLRLLPRGGTQRLPEKAYQMHV